MQGLFALIALLSAQEPGATVEFAVDGMKRTAIIYAPAPAGPTAPPLIIAFHGHGGTSWNAARRFQLHMLWPEAVVVYPQGLTGTPGITDPMGLRPGWQKAPGQNGDRDVKFVDAIKERARKVYGVSKSQSFAFGHSNGSAMTWVLYATRSNDFAAFAGASAGGGRYVLTAPDNPSLVICGMDDTVVKFEGVKRFAEALVRKQGCAMPGKVTSSGTTVYEGKSPVVTYFRPGGHAFRPEWSKLIVDFFQGIGKSDKSSAKVVAPDSATTAGKP